MHRAPSPAVAALLSFIFPGLGQAYAGRPRRGTLFALPMLVLLVGLVLLIAAGPANLLGMLLRQEVLLAVAAINVAVLLYRLAAIVDAYLLARPGTSPRRWLNGAAAVLALLLVGTAAMHCLTEYVRCSAATGLATIFHDGDLSDDWAIPEPGWHTPSPLPPTPAPTIEPGATPSPFSPSPSPAPTSTPFSGPEWARDGRLNIVLLGSDEGPGRWSLRPDAIFLLSVEVETGRAAIFGFWRYMSNIPLPPESAEHFDGGRFARHINALYVAAQDNPGRFPGNDARGLRVVAGAVQELAGVRVDHYVMVNLNGFVDVVDAMGGLWIDVPERVRDDRYALETGRRRITLDFRSGCQFLDGRMALAYARTRHQDGDWSRMARQQHTLAAMRRQFDPLAVLPRLPDLFEAAGDNLYWTLQEEDVVPIAQLAGKVDADRLQRVLFVPPDFEPELSDETIDAIRTRVRGIFDEPEPPPPTPAPPGERCPPDG
ncbi:hypothetical protein BH24CHL6_BH24CHL6_05350 [soil metagenome]